MKKLLLSACICLMGLSAQASNDGIDLWGGPTWQSHENHENAERAAWNYFYQASIRELGKIELENLKLAMEKFPEFLTWKLGPDKRTIVHCVAYRGDPETLRYVLGFFPNLDNIKDNLGKSPYDYRDSMPGANAQVLLQFQQQPWRHSEEVLELANKPLVKKNDLTSFFSDIFDRKVLGVLGTMVLLGLFYRYKGNKGKEQSAAE